MTANDKNVFQHSTRVELVSGPNNGSLNLDEGGGFLYNPDAGFVGRDTYEYRVTNGRKSEIATVTIDVTNQHGVAKSDHYTTTRNN